MRYPTHLKVLDGFGLLALTSAGLFVSVPDSWRPLPKVDDLWGGISTEMLGIWVGVRFIEWIINSHESATKARVRIVRNMRLIERLFHNLSEFQRSYEMRILLRDVQWGRERLELRRKHLSPDEMNDVLAFFSVVDEMLATLPAECPPPQTTLQISNPTLFAECSRKLESARRQAEFNILDETDEDSGI
jgi:hypothetical protein